MDQKSIGRFLRELRVGGGLTQEQAAAELGVSARTVSCWETGANLPDLEVLVCLADFYGVGIREVLDGIPMQLSNLNTVSFRHFYNSSPASVAVPESPSTSSHAASASA